MITQCSWCKKDLGEKPPLEDKSVTHTICDACSNKMMKEETMNKPIGQPRKLNLTDKMMNEVILYGGFPMTRANVYRQCLEDTGDAKAADLFAFGSNTKLAPEGTEPMSREDFKALTEPDAPKSQDSILEGKAYQKTKHRKAKRHSTQGISLGSMR